jgi:hypothetical protein
MSNARHPAAHPPGSLAELPADAKERHDLLTKSRQEAFEKLCDTVYKEKGFTSDAIPLPETIAKLGLLDEKVSLFKTWPLFFSL